MVRDSVTSCFNKVCLPFLSGKKPSKQNRFEGIPLLTSAGTKAVAPGRVSTARPAYTQALTSKKAGSEIPGVPASVTNAIVVPEESCCNSCGTSLCSLCW